MQSILFITYKTSPIKGIGSIRSSKFAKYLSKFGFNVFVISTTNCFLAHKEDYIKNCESSIKFYRIPTIDYQTIKFIIFRLLNFFKRKKNKFYTIELKQKYFLYNLFNLFPLSIFLGEGGILYIIISIFFGLFLIKKYKIKYIFSSYSPFSDHIIAWSLKIFNKKLIWIADFRDLHIQKAHELRFNSPFIIKLNIIIDKFILKNADAITVVSEGLKERLKEYHNEIYVLRNGFDPEEIIIKNVDEIKDFSFLYAGALYENRRDPTILLECLNNLITHKKIKKPDVKLYYAGRDNILFEKLCSKYNLTDVYYNFGFISRDKVLDLERKSYFLIMLTWASNEEKGIMTGKFYEYLGANRFIICIVNGDRDKELERIFKMTNCGIVVYSNSDLSKKILTNFILNHYKKYKSGKFQTKYNWNVVNKFSYINLAYEMNKIYKKMEKNNSL